MSRNSWQESGKKSTATSTAASSKQGQQKASKERDFKTTPSPGSQQHRQRTVNSSKSKARDAGGNSENQQRIKDVSPSPRPIRAFSSNSEAPPSLTTTPRLSASLSDRSARRAASADAVKADPSRIQRLLIRRPKSLDAAAAKKEARQFKPNPRKGSVSTSSNNGKHQKPAATQTLATPTTSKNKKTTKHVQRSISHSAVGTGTSTENNTGSSGGNGAANLKRISSRAASRSHSNITSAPANSKNRNILRRSHGDSESGGRSSTDMLPRDVMRHTELQLPSCSNLMPFEPPDRKSVV